MKPAGEEYRVLIRAFKDGDGGVTMHRTDDKGLDIVGLYIAKDHKVVPIEPTDDMYIAANFDHSIEIYKNMIEAAPEIENIK